MNAKAAERRLAAILSADVAGYSRLMAEDEAATIRMLTDYRDEIALLVRQHRGRVVDAPGDNLLAEFPSATDAVRSAVEVQRVLQVRNAPLAEDRRMEFRIGVHLGEVRAEADRIYGDGVNIAARLQELAKAGGVCVSGTVSEQIEKKLSVQLEDLGEQALKNIPRLVHVYGVRLVLPEGGSEAPRDALPGLDELTVPGFSGRSAIAVLPFDNLSGDPEQEYFADGITEDLITRLSHLRWFPVVARNSTFVYKHKSIDVKQVSRELGVRYVVEGSVRKAGARVRISAQLIEATTGHHVWAERFDRDLRDVFAIQDEITEAIARMLEPKLWHSEWERTLRREPSGLDAWECYYRGWWHWRQYRKEENAKARSLFERASELDPHFVWPVSGIAFSHQADIQNQWSESPARSLDAMEEAAKRAVALDENDALAQTALGSFYRLKGQRDRAITAFERAVRLDPSFAAAWFQLGVTLALMSRAEEAIANLEKAMRLSPQDIFLHEFLFAMALAHAAAERFDESIRWAQRSLQCKSDFPMAHLSLAACYARLGRLDDARSALAESLRLNPNLSLGGLKRTLSYADPAFGAGILDALRQAGLKED